MTELKNKIPKVVTIHPLVLLSVVDHYNRVAKNTTKRVVGILLGQQEGDVVNVSNSFSVPFDEDEKDAAANVWYLDHDYLEQMYQMYKKIAAKEKIVGWYHSGPKLRRNDLEIEEYLRKYIQTKSGSSGGGGGGGVGVLVIVDVNPQASGLPTKSYVALEEIHDDGTKSSRTFAHIPSEIVAEEAEEVGVEHLLRDVTDSFLSNTSLSTRVSTLLQSLSYLKSHLVEVEMYLQKVVRGELEQNHEIMYMLQNIFSQLGSTSEVLKKGLTAKVNDDLLLVYLGSLSRAVVSLHRLIDNKIENQEHERQEKQAENSSVVVSGIEGK
ncbi:hypothetical protein MP638_002681 [Amoeboaphelidium occidentale]|nr:hypothetical protein MP638_002681 [Amoeboaphelidium occidentale]